MTTSTTPEPTTSPSTPRRVFRSKVDDLRPTYGFEDVSLAPGTETIEPADVDVSISFAGIDLRIPILASAMDAVVDARFAGELARLGGLAILNLEGVQARYDDPDAVLERIASAADDAVQDLLAEAYAAPIQDEIVARRIAEIHAAGSRAAWRRATTRCRSATSPASCRSPSRSETRRTPRRRSR
jgi:IMP dehydrogenase/GMP reductase